MDKFRINHDNINLNVIKSLIDPYFNNMVYILRNKIWEIGISQGLSGYPLQSRSHN